MYAWDARYKFALVTPKIYRGKQCMQEKTL